MTTRPGVPQGGAGRGGLSRPAPLFIVVTIRPADIRHTEGGRQQPRTGSRLLTASTPVARPHRTGYAPTRVAPRDKHSVRNNGVHVGAEHLQIVSILH